VQEGVLDLAARLFELLVCDKYFLEVSSECIIKKVLSGEQPQTLRRFQEQCANYFDQSVDNQVDQSFRQLCKELCDLKPKWQAKQEGVEQHQQHQPPNEDDYLIALKEDVSLTHISTGEQSKRTMVNFQFHASSQRVLVDLVEAMLCSLSDCLGVRHGAEGQLFNYVALLRVMQVLVHRHPLLLLRLLKMNVLKRLSPDLLILAPQLEGCSGSFLEFLVRGLTPLTVGRLKSFLL